MLTIPNTLISTGGLRPTSSNSRSFLKAVMMPTYAAVNRRESQKPKRRQGIKASPKRRNAVFRASLNESFQTIKTTGTGAGINTTPMIDPINNTKTALKKEIPHVRNTGIKIVTTTIKLSTQTIVAKPKIPSGAPFAIRMHRHIIWKKEQKGTFLFPKC